MRSSYKKIGGYVQQANKRNKDMAVTNLRGININKLFMPSVANTIGVDLSKYKVVSKHQFAFNPMHVGRDEKLPISMLEADEPVIVSPAYVVFEIRDHEELDPEYLMMWCRRPEFDRNAWFTTDSSVRGGFSWSDFCEMELPIPSIEKQREIVREYRTIVCRIQLKEHLNQKLEETAQAIYKHWFVDFEFPTSAEYAASVGKPELERKPYKSSGGEMVFCEELEQEIPKGWNLDNLKNIATIKGGKRLPKGESLIDAPTQHPYIKVVDLGKNKYVSLNNRFQYLTDDIQNKISRYVVKANDLILSLVGTIGLIRIVDKSLNGANLTENCAKITMQEKVSSDYIYYFLNSWLGQNEIEMKTVGGGQGKLPIYNIEVIRILCPNDTAITAFSDVIDNIKSSQTLIFPIIDRLEQAKSIVMSRMALRDKLSRGEA